MMVIVSGEASGVGRDVAATALAVSTAVGETAASVGNACALGVGCEDRWQAASHVQLRVAAKTSNRELRVFIHIPLRGVLSA